MVCSSKWQLVRKERIKARIPVAPPEPMCTSTELPQALREAKPTINIKEDVGIPLGNKWGCVLNKGVGGGSPRSLEVPQTDHGKMEKMRPSHYEDAVKIADANFIWNQLESFPSSSGLGFAAHHCGRLSEMHLLAWNRVLLLVLRISWNALRNPTACWVGLSEGLTLLTNVDIFLFVSLVAGDR